MELTQLKYFLTTANCGQITRAAEMLHVSQSAVSTAISRLEKELSVDLFCKSGRNIRLTDNGARFAALITPAVAQLDFARDEMLAVTRVEAHAILLSVEAPDFSNEMERMFYKRSPETRFYQSTDPTEAAAQKLRCNSVDFCISYEPFDDPDIISEEVLCERVMVQFFQGHPLADRESLWLSELENESFISFSRGFGFRSWMEKLCFLAGFRPSIRFEVCDTQSIMTMLTVGQAVAFIAESTWKNLGKQAYSVGQKDNPIVAVPLKDAFCLRRVFLCYHRSRVLSQEARDFRDFLRQFYVAMKELRDVAEAEKRFFPD